MRLRHVVYFVAVVWILIASEVAAWCLCLAPLLSAD